MLRKPGMLFCNDSVLYSVYLRSGHDFFFYLKGSCLGNTLALSECNKFSGYDFSPTDVYV